MAIQSLLYYSTYIYACVSNISTRLDNTQLYIIISLIPQKQVPHRVYRFGSRVKILKVIILLYMVYIYENGTLQSYGDLLLLWGLVVYEWFDNGKLATSRLAIYSICTARVSQPIVFRCSARYTAYRSYNRRDERATDVR